MRMSGPLFRHRPGAFSNLSHFAMKTQPFGTPFCHKQRCKMPEMASPNGINPEIKPAINVHSRHIYSAADSRCHADAAGIQYCYVPEIGWTIAMAASHKQPNHESQSAAARYKTIRGGCIQMGKRPGSNEEETRPKADADAAAWGKGCVRTIKRPDSVLNPAFRYIAVSSRKRMKRGSRIIALPCLSLYGGYAGQHFSLYCLEQGAAACRDVRHLVCHSELVDTSHRVAASEQ